MRRSSNLTCQRKLYRWIFRHRNCKIFTVRLQRRPGALCYGCCNFPELDWTIYKMDWDVRDNDEERLLESELKRQLLLINNFYRLGKKKYDGILPIRGNAVGLRPQRGRRKRGAGKIWFSISYLPTYPHVGNFYLYTFITSWPFKKTYWNHSS